VLKGWQVFEHRGVSRLSRLDSVHDLWKTLKEMFKVLYTAWNPSSHKALFLGLFTLCLFLRLSDVQCAIRSHYLLAVCNQATGEVIHAAQHTLQPGVTAPGSVSCRGNVLCAIVVLHLTFRLLHSFQSIVPELC